MTHDTNDGDPLLSNFISGLGETLVERKEASWSLTAGSAASTLTTIVMPTTITVNSTVVQTTFVTITTHVAPPTSTACAEYGSTTCGPDSRTKLSSDRHTSLPKIVTRSSSPAFSHTSDGSQHAETTSAAATKSTGGSMSRAERHAVIGGLSGTIAGLVLIGLLLAIFFRRRQKRDTESITSSENGLREVISRNWSQLTRRTTPPISRGNIAEVAPMPPMSRQSSAGDFNGSLLRVSMGQWPRPFAQNESFRESVGPSRLRVMNPDDDPSRSASPAPRGSTESGGTYLRRQRSAITAAVFGGGSHSRTSSNAPSRQRSVKVPSIKVDSLSSSERGGPRYNNAPAPSFMSSVSSLQTVQHQPPEDPFLTPPEGSVQEEPQPSRLQRPSLATIQSAAGAAGRSLSSLGHALNPFRSRSNTVDQDEPEPSIRSSSTTFSSNGDPFRLDRRSVPDNSAVMEEAMPREVERVHIPPWRLYDGT